MRRLRVLLAAAALLPPGAGASTARWYLHLENDAVFATDRWYSSGARLGRVAASGPVGIEWGLVHEIYTPEAKRWRPGADDRSPTARLLGYGARHRGEGGRLDTWELGIGVRGPSALGRQVTGAAHELVDAREIDWSRQDGDRLDAQVVFARSQPLAGLRLHYGAVAGSQVAFVHGGLEWRTGRGPALGAASPALRFAATPPPPATGSGWAAFAGASVRAVARNAAIRRNYDAFGAQLEPRRAVGRAVGGAAWVDEAFSATLALVAESREFAAQRTWQRFWSLGLHVDF